MSSINKSGAGYSSNYNEQVCSSQPKEELTCSAPPPEELVCKAPPGDKTKVNSIPKGKADKPVVLFDDSTKASFAPKAPVCSTAIKPEDMVCSEKNYSSEPEPQNASPVEADINVNMSGNK